MSNILVVSPDDEHLIRLWAEVDKDGEWYTDLRPTIDELLVRRFTDYHLCALVDSVDGSDLALQACHDSWIVPEPSPSERLHLCYWTFGWLADAARGRHRLDLRQRMWRVTRRYWYRIFGADSVFGAVLAHNRYGRRWAEEACMLFLVGIYPEWQPVRGVLTDHAIYAEVENEGELAWRAATARKHPDAPVVAYHERRMN